MSKDNWVSFPQAYEKSGGGVQVGYTGLPAGLDPERLEINIDGLRRGVIDWGGYSAVTLAAYSGEADQYNIGTNGADPSGTASATGIASVSKAESSQHVPASDQKLNDWDIRNGVLGVQWNINALNSRIQTHEQYDPKIRAKQFNTTIKKAAIGGVWSHNIENLLKDRPPLTTTVGMIADSFFAYPFTHDLIKGNYPGALSEVATRVLVMTTMVRWMRSQRMHAAYKYVVVDPVFFTARPTRTAIGVGVLASSKLVRAAGNKPLTATQES